MGDAVTIKRILQSLIAHSYAYAGCIVRWYPFFNRMHMMTDTAKNPNQTKEEFTHFWISAGSEVGSVKSSLVVETLAHVNHPENSAAITSAARAKYGLTTVLSNRYPPPAAIRKYGISNHRPMYETLGDPRIEGSVITVSMGCEMV
jgi:hypothetical protein